MNELRQCKKEYLGPITVEILNLIESLKENNEILDSADLHKDAEWTTRNEVGDVMF